MFWWSGPGSIFSTQTWGADISSKITCYGMTCWKRNQNVVYTVESVWGFTGIKLSNVGDSYLWNITSDICRMGLVWIWLLTTNKVCSSQHNVLSVTVFFIQSRRIDHKHGIMLSDHRDAGLEQIWPRTADENLPTSLFIFCYLVKKSPWIIS